MRKSEIQNLKWSDIDINRHLITLHETKNGESRHVPMNNAARENFLSLTKHPDSPYVFAGKEGKPFDFRKAFETAVKKCKITDFRFHDLRHTFASHLVMAGVNLAVVKELLGHKTLKMTERYSHLSPDHKAKAVDILSVKIDTQSAHAPKDADELKKQVAVSSDKETSSKNYAGVAQW